MGGDVEPYSVASFARFQDKFTQLHHDYEFAY